MVLRKAVFSVFLLLAMFSNNAMSATTDLVGSASWTNLMAGGKFDPYSDTQANKAGTEIVGDITHPSSYINYDDNGTTTGTTPESDDILSFRLRIGDETKNSHSAYAFFGIDANNDGVLDAFVSSGAGETSIWDADPSTSNTSPATTSVASPASYIYAQTASNYNFAAVSVANDPDWTIDDLDGDGNTDVFISFSIPIADLDAFLATQGITFTQDTALRFISLTATQSNSLNSDFNGVDKSSVDDWFKTFKELEIIKEPFTETPPVITLVGTTPLSILLGSVYIDAGATAFDEQDGVITANITTVNPVDTSVLGTYTVTYDVIDSAGNAATQVTRIVNVVAAADTVPPVITLLGSTPVNIDLCSTYTDAGATALDDVDGDITSQIVTVNPVKSGTEGTYTVTYNVNDSSGNAATQVTRTVNVTFNGAIDSDGDGILNSSEGKLDTDGDGVCDYKDLDADNDGILDSVEGIVDTDNDGVSDYKDLDTDNDGIFDLIESGAANTKTLDVNNDGQIDPIHKFGTNGLADDVETSVDSGTVNYNNGIPLDTDNDTTYDFRDIDSDGDGIYDVIEAGGTDGDNDGVVGTGIPPVDTNGVPSTGAGLTPPDSDSDGIPDYLDTVDDSKSAITTGINGVGPVNPWLLIFLAPLVLLGRRMSSL